MGFDKQSVGPRRDASTGDGFDERGSAASHATALVGLLQGVGAIEYNGCTEGTHDRNAPKIHNQVLVAKRGAALREHDVGVAFFAYFFGGKLHGFWTDKLPFFDVHHLAGLRGGHQQGRLTTQESRDLKHVHILSCKCGFWFSVYVRGSGNEKRIAYFLKDLKRFFVAYTCERIAFAAVGFAVRTLENVGDTQALTNFVDLSGNIKGHLLAFNSTGPCDEKKIVGIGVLEAR